MASNDWQDDMNDPRRFRYLTEEQQQLLLEWIKTRLKPLTRGRRKTGWTQMHSYGLKHVFERDREYGGFYVDNGQFKGALLEAGADVVKTEPNWDVRALVFDERWGRQERMG